MPPPTQDEIVGLAMTIRGRLILPMNEREYKYQQQKAHNAEFWSREPVFFALCHDTADVQQILKFATAHELPVSVRSGGHGACGSHCRNGSVVIDLSRIRHVEYNADTETVTVGPGATLADINVHLLRHSRMTPVGIAPPTGLGGLALHGGTGWLTHKFGTSVDQITQMNLILADGSVRDLDSSSRDDDRELFFAARGAVSLLGICTNFSLRTYHMEMVTGGFWMMVDDAKYTATRKLIGKARDIINKQEEAGNRTLVAVICMGNAPPDTSIPEETHHSPCSLVLLCSFGTDEAAKTLVKEFVDREIVFGKPPAVMPFNIFNQVLTGMFLNFPPFATYWSAVMMGGDGIPDDKIDCFCDHWARHEPWMGGSLVGFEFQGGKEGYEHGKRINQGNEHCVSDMTKDWIVTAVGFVYTPVGPEFDTKRRDMSKQLIAVFERLGISDYSNYQSKDVLIPNERIMKIKAKVDPGNLFNRSG